MHPFLYYNIILNSLSAINNYVGGSRDAKKIQFFLEIRETCVCLVELLEA